MGFPWVGIASRMMTSPIATSPSRKVTLLRAPGQKNPSPLTRMMAIIPPIISRQIPRPLPANQMAGSPRLKNSRRGLGIAVPSNGSVTLPEALPHELGDRVDRERHDEQQTGREEQ